MDNKIITHPKYFPTVSPSTNNNLVQIVGSGPDSDWKTIMQGVVSIIAGASQYVYIHTPYLIPTESVLIVFPFPINSTFCGGIIP